MPYRCVVEPPDPQLTSLGSFDPLTLMLEFSDRYRVQPPEGRWHKQYLPLSRVPTSILAHELAHLVHTLGTAAGLRQYLLAVDHFRVRLELVRAATEASDGAALRVPIVKNLASYTDTERLTGALETLGRLFVTSAVYGGGYRDEESAPNINLSWLQSDTVLDGIELGWETSHCYLGYHTGQQQSVMLGYRHLTEGVAKIVERTQRRFTGEEGERSPHGLVRMSPEEFANHRTSPFDPYYVASAVFHDARLFENPETRVPGYEDYVAVLADIAMMVDPLVTPRSFAAIFRTSGAEALDLAKTGYSPFVFYHRLCHLFWRSVDKLPTFAPDEIEGHMTTHVAALQNGVLAAAGSDLTMYDLTIEARESLTDLAPFLDAHVFMESEEGRDVYRRGFDRVLSWRADTLDGAAIFEDLLTGREALLNHAQWWSPSYAVGGDLYSGFDVRPGDGVGVEQMNIRMMSSVVDAICLKNAPCELRGPRGDKCALPRIGLCREIPDGVPIGEPYCVREQFLSVLRDLGVPRLEWAT